MRINSIGLLFLILVGSFVYEASAAKKSISYSDFELNSKESTFVDKTLFIKDLLEERGNKIVITAPRGFGKTANVQMLKAFFQLEVDKKGEKITAFKDGIKPVKDTPNYKTFQQLKIMDHKELMQKHFGKYPVIFLDYGTNVRFLYFNETEDFFKEVLHEAYLEHCYLENSEKLFDDEKDYMKRMCSDNYLEEEVGSLMPGIAKLAKYLYKHFDKAKVFVLVDHYDSPIYNCVYDPDVPPDVFNYVVTVAQMLFNIRKDDFYIDTFFITGISQIKESHFNSENVIKRYEFLNEHQYVPYFGLTEDEVFDLLGRYTIEVDNNIFESVQHHYGGYVSMNNITVHNVWAILHYFEKQRFDHVWARGNEAPHLNLLLKIPDIKTKLERMLKGLPVAMDLNRYFTQNNLNILRDLLINPRGKQHLLYTTLFYSFIFEQGYLTYDPEEKSVISNTRRYFIPNEEVKEFLWKELDE